MTDSHKQDRPGGNPTLWTVAALRWALKDSEQECGIGEEIETVEVPDRELAVAIAHHLLDKHAHEAIGKMSLEVHVAPPKQALPDKESSGFRSHLRSSLKALPRNEPLARQMFRHWWEGRIAREKKSKGDPSFAGLGRELRTAPHRNLGSGLETHAG